MVDEGEFFFEEEGIDPTRIVDDEHHVAQEFFCAICQGLLWKPRSCASCQHLFCRKCINTWLKINATSCPYRCSPYEEKRAPPYIHTLLGRLSIRCRNSSFGCREVLSYDLLEQHETTACQFPTRQCRICRQYMLIEDIDQHQISCVPTTIECFLCKCPVDPASFQQHTAKCLGARLNLLVEQIIPTNNLPILPEEQDDDDNENWATQLNHRLQQFLSVAPKIDLVGFDAVVQARQRSICTRAWSMFQLILFNKSQAMHIVLLLLCYGIGCCMGCLFYLALFVEEQVEISIYRSSIFILLVSGLISFGLPIFFASITDTLIIVCVVITLLLCSMTYSELPFDYFRVRLSFPRTLLLCFLVFLLLKLPLLLIRCYFWYLPPYITAGSLAWIVIFVAFHARGLYADDE